MFAGYNKKPGNIDDLVLKLTSGNDVERWRAIEELGAIGAPALHAMLVALFVAEENEVSWIGRAFHEMGDLGLKYLREALKHPGMEARRAAISALMEFGSDGAGAVSDLARALEDVDPEVRWRAARALGRIGAAARAALSSLEKAIYDRDGRLADEARKAIGRINPTV